MAAQPRGRSSYHQTVRFNTTRRYILRGVYVTATLKTGGKKNPRISVRQIRAPMPLGNKGR